MSTSVEQLSSLIHLVTHQIGEALEDEKLEWLRSALTGKKKNLIQYLAKLIIAESTSKLETKLALLLLSLITVLVRSVSDESVKEAVLADLRSVESFWTHILSLIADESNSASVRVNAVSLCVNAHRLGTDSDGNSEWPPRIFSIGIIEAVTSILQSHQSSFVTLNSRTLAVSLDYLLLAWRRDHGRVIALLASRPRRQRVVPVLLEASAQLMIAADRRKELIGFDPLTWSIETRDVRELANQLVEIGGDRVHTSLALMCID